MPVQPTPWPRPLRAPWQEVALSLIDGTVYRWTPMRHHLKATRLAIPAPYDASNVWGINNTLRGWNQAWARQGGSVWANINPNMGITRYNMPYLVINSATSAVFHFAEDYSKSDVFVTSWRIIDASNWVFDKPNHKYQFEFFLDNDLEETASGLLYEDDETAWAANAWNVGSYACAVSEDTSEQQKGSSCLKFTISAGSNDRTRAYIASPPITNWSSYEFVCFYFKGRNSGTIIDLYVLDGASKAAYWRFTDNFTGWKRFVFPINTPNYDEGVDLSDITHLDFRCSPTSTGDWFIDRIVLDVGQWVKFETYVPDVLDGIVKNAQVWSWNGSAFVQGLSWDAEDRDNQPSAGPHNGHYFLDGTVFSSVYATTEQGLAGYWKGERGETVGGVYTGVAGTITYLPYYGGLKRVGFGFKMPPDDGQDSSTTGISQILLRLLIRYDGEKTVKDSVGRNHGTRISALSATGKYGKGLEFDGVYDYVRVPDSPSLDLTSAITISAWIKSDAFAAGWTYTIVSKQDDAGDTYKLTFYGDVLYFLVKTDVGSKSVSKDINPSTGTWYHVCGTYENGSIKVYLDNQVASDTHTGAILTNNSPLAIGRYPVSSLNHFNGVIDEVCIYNRALSPTEVAALYNGGRITDGLVSEWRFEDEWNFGQSTYEFSNDTDLCYGLHNMNESWLVAFDQTTKRIECLILSKRPTGMKVRQNEDHLIDRVDVTLAKGTRVFAGELTHGDLTRDSDGDGVPDFLSGGVPTTEVNPAVIYDDDESIWSSGVWGTGSVGAFTLVEETTEKYKGTSSLKATVPSGAGSDPWITHNPSGTWNWSSYKFLCLYLYGLNNGKTNTLYLYTDGSNFNRYQWTDNFVGWKRLVFALRNPTSQQGTGCNVSSVDYLTIAFAGLNVNDVIYVDRLVVDVDSPIGLPYLVSKLFQEGYP